MSKWRILRHIHSYMYVVICMYILKSFTQYSQDDLVEKLVVVREARLGFPPSPPAPRLGFPPSRSAPPPPPAPLLEFPMERHMII